MENASVQARTRPPADRRPRVSIAWVLPLILAMWLSALLPWGQMDRPDLRGAAAKSQGAAQKDVLEIIAELRGDYRSLDQIRKGNELVDAVSRGDEAGVRKALAA